MPILFGLFGIILVVSGVRGRVTQGNPSLVSLIQADFTGSDPFWKWMLAILLIGAVGYIPNLRPISRAFMALVIIVFLLSNQGLFTQLQAVFKNTSTNTVPTSSPLPNTTALSGTGTSLMPTGDVQGILNTAGLMATGVNPLE
jgi:hypothetical protein